MSHELRTPLAALSGALGLIQGGVSGPLSEQAGRLVAIAVANSRRLGSLIDNVLDLQDAERGTLRLQLTSVSPREVVERAMRDAAPLASAAGVTIAAEGEGPEVVRGDPERLAQVLNNLLSNAIKWSPAGAQVLVRSAHTRAGTGLRLAVKYHRQSRWLHEGPPEGASET